MPNPLEIEILTKYLGADKAKAAADDLEKLRGSTKDLNESMGVIKVSNEDLAKATAKTSEAVEKGTEKFGGARLEIREVGNELGRAVGVSRLGGLALGGVAAAAFSAGKAIEFFKWAWDQMSDAIKGPIEIGVPTDVTTRINDAATAWQNYAEARSKIIASQNSPEARASAEEKKLTNELKLIHEVLKAEEEKAKADLELHKEEMSPEAYKAAQENISNIFGEAGTQADEKNRRAQIDNKRDEAFNLEIDAGKKTHQALGLKLETPQTQEAWKTISDKAAKEKDEVQSRIDFIKKVSTPDKQIDYAGPMGFAKEMADRLSFHFRYGDSATAKDALGIEEPRLAQAEAQKNLADQRIARQDKLVAEQKQLMDEAGSESGKASVLRGEVKNDSVFETKQNAVDSHVAELHQAAADKITAQSANTAKQVEKVLWVTLRGFTDISAVLDRHERALEDHGLKISRALHNSQLH